MRCNNTQRIRGSHRGVEAGAHQFNRRHRAARWPPALSGSAVVRINARGKAGANTSGFTHLSTRNML